MSSLSNISSRSDSLRNRAQILKAAREVFAELGPEASLSRVVEASGLGRGSVYRHFPNRFELISAIFDENFEALEKLAAQFQDKPEQFQKVFSLLLNQIVEAKGFIAIAISSGLEHQEFKEHSHRLKRLLTPLLNQAKSDRIIAAHWEIEDLLLLIKMISGAVFYDPEEKIELTVNRILKLVNLNL